MELQAIERTAQGSCCQPGFAADEDKARERSYERKSSFIYGKEKHVNDSTLFAAASVKRVEHDYERLICVLVCLCISTPLCGTLRGN